jgi:hypothetical protein
MAAYGSREQRRMRYAALLLLGFKHGLRGLLFSWPAYVLALAAAYSEALHALTYLALLVPAVALSIYLLVRGVRDDYRSRVEDVLLRKGFVRALMLTQDGTV